MGKRIFISADHGLAIVYFLQSDIIPEILKAGYEVVVLTDDALKEKIADQFRQPGMDVEGLRFNEAQDYAQKVERERQWWVGFLRRTASSNRINTEAMDSYIRQIAGEEANRRRLILPAALLALAVLRRSKAARRRLIGLQRRYTPDLYGELFERYKPSLVAASTYGWRLDRYLLREAAARKIKTAAAIVGWDNPSSYGLPAARVDWVSCWSDIQKEELILGSDWEPDKVHIGGIPSYDGYFRKEWLVPRPEYFGQHSLDPDRKLIAYAASFVSFSPNFQNVQALAELVSSDQLAKPSQLLIRLHPNHFMDNPLYKGERKRIRELAESLPHVHMVEPVSLGGSMGYYSGEDMPEKTSMMAYSDVFVTVYSTMVVEAAVHNRPIVSACIDTPGGWNHPRKFSLPLSKIGNWPTHSRFRHSGAGMVALDKQELREALNHYLLNPEAGCERRAAFIKNECTFTDGSAGKRTGEWLVRLLESI
jgi:hypothetical protein